MIENFDRLSDTDKLLICALPYRVGLWMSALEGAGGDVADEAEVNALIGAVEQMARNTSREFAAYVCRQTLSRRDLWLEWSSNLDKVPMNCQQVIKLLQHRIPSEDLNHFREALFLIAASVARAYGEAGDDFNLILANDGEIPVVAARILRQLSSESGAGEGDFVKNISGKEAQALLELAGYLGLDRASYSGYAA